MSRTNILLVDDQPDNLLALEAVLEPLEQNLVRAESGDEALKLLLKDDYAVILLDVHMPGLDGFETAALIKQRDRTRLVPIIFVTAISKGTEHVFRGYTEGAVDYLLKPFDPAVLRSKVSVFVQLYEKTAALEASEQRFRTAFANAPAGAALVGGDGRLAEVNLALAHLLGRPEAELVGATVEEALGPGPLHGERRILRPDGAERVVMISAAGMPNGAGPDQQIVQLDDATERWRAEQERAERLREQAARAEAEAMTTMVRSLQSVSDAALTHLALDDLLPELLARIRDVVGADGVTVLLTDPDDESVMEQRATSGVSDAAAGTRVTVGRDSFAGRVAKERRIISIGDLSAADAATVADRALRESGLRTVTGIPLVAEGQVRGVLRAGWREPNRFTDEEGSLLSLMADRAALAIGNARLYERERRVVETLQRSLLPRRMPRLPGISIAACYQPGGSDVGGDWYDAMPVGDGQLALAMGDVVGHGLAAAALMGEIRSALRAYAAEDPSPRSVVTRVDKLMKQSGENQMATLLYALMDPDAETLSYVCAGHLPPLVVDPDGGSRYLWGARSTPLGFGQNDLEEGREDLQAGSTLVLYTDGLVEVPGEDIDVGLERLQDAVTEKSIDLGTLCDRVLETLRPEPARDDIALLAMSIEPVGQDLSLEFGADLVTLRRGRRMLGRWLEHVGAEDAVAGEIQLACHEACAEAARHVRGTEASFRLEGTHSEGEVKIVVRDSGARRETTSGGDGHPLALMKGLMDDVDVHSGPDGTVTALTRRLS